MALPPSVMPDRVIAGALGAWFGMATVTDAVAVAVAAPSDTVNWKLCAPATDGVKVTWPPESVTVPDDGLPTAVSVSAVPSGSLEDAMTVAAGYCPLCPSRKPVSVTAPATGGRLATTVDAPAPPIALLPWVSTLAALPNSRVIAPPAWPIATSATTPTRPTTIAYCCPAAARRPFDRMLVFPFDSAVTVFIRLAPDDQ